METMMKCYIPVVDQENPNAVGLTSEQVEQIKRLNSASTYTGSDVKNKLYMAPYSELLIAMEARRVFIYERTSVLAKRMCNARLENSADYLNNLACAFADNPSRLMQTGIRIYFDDRIDTTPGLDTSKIPNLLMLYSYELYQMNSLRINGMM